MPNSVPPVSLQSHSGEAENVLSVQKLKRSLCKLRLRDEELRLCRSSLFFIL